LGRVQMGEQAAGRHTATESAQVQGAHDLMISYYRDVVQDVILDLVRDAHKLIAGTPAVPGFWTDERLIDLTNDLGQQVMVPFRGTQLQGDYNFEVNIDTGPPPSRMAMKQERAVVAQHLANHPRVNQDYLLHWVAEAFDDLDGDRLIVPEQQYIEATKATLQAQQQQEQAGYQRDQAAQASADERKQDAKLQQTAVQAAITQGQPRGE